MINEYIARNGRTEDGDYIMVRTIEADSIVEAKEVTKQLQDEVTRGGSKAHYNITWAGKGGKLVWTDTYVVDQVEVAIEAANDAWAREQAFREPEWAH
jgi:hypothetical protein